MCEQSILHRLNLLIIIVSYYYYYYYYYVTSSSNSSDIGPTVVIDPNSWTSIAHIDFGRMQMSPGTPCSTKNVWELVDLFAFM